jgi:hypothetical protein
MSGQTAASSSPRALSTSRCGRCHGPAMVQHWTLRCTRCSHISQMQVVSDPSQSEPVDWFDGPLGFPK